MHRGLIRLAATGAAAIALASSFVGAPAAAKSAKLHLEPCSLPEVDLELRCGVFEVPENRDRPTGRMLPLKVVVIPAEATRPAAEPVFYFEGGPGQAATKSASYIANLWIRDNNDVVLIDQRGTGDGHFLDCTLPGSDDDIQGYLEPAYPALKNCAAELATRADLTQYTTSIAMQDADEIRRALGYDKINVYGGSYGSRAAMVYTKLFGEHVRTQYLSGAAPLEARMPLYFAWSAQRALNAIVEACMADSKCKDAYPDPVADLAAVRQRLKRGPARLQVTHPVTRQPVDVTLSEWGFVTSIRSKLYSADDPAVLASALRRARQGDFKELVEDWIRATRSTANSFASGMNAAVVCNEDVARISRRKAERGTVGSFLGSAQLMGHLDFCQAWPKAEYPPNFFAPFISNVPTLVTSGKYDPVTPPHWGEVARASFPNSLHIIASVGHSNFEETGCLAQISSEFLRTGSVEDLSLDCARPPAEKLEIVD